MPSSLAFMNISEVRSAALNSPPPAVFRALWHISRSLATAHSAAEYLVPGSDMFTQDPTVKDIRRHSDLFAAAGRLTIRKGRRLQVLRSFARMGPAHRIRLLKYSAVIPRALGIFIKDSKQANCPRKAKSSFPGLVYYPRFCTAFCELRMEPRPGL